MTAVPTQLLEKLSVLPPALFAEVETFVDMLRQRGVREGVDFAAASEPSFARVWDNPEDAAYDEL